MEIELQHQKQVSNSSYAVICCRVKALLNMPSSLSAPL